MTLIQLLLVAVVVGFSQSHVSGSFCPGGTESRSTPTGTLCLQCSYGSFSLPGGTCTNCTYAAQLTDMGSKGYEEFIKFCESGACNAAEFLGVFQNPSTSIVGCGCMPGSFLSATEGKCVACALGTYSAEGNLTKCNPCSSGTTNSKNTDGRTVPCTRCSEGLYNSQAGATACLECPQTPEPTSVSSGQDGCICSSPGYGFSVDQCKICKAGTVPTGSGVANSTLTCQLCPLNAIAPAEGSNECQTCPSGKLANDTRTVCVDRVQCPEEGMTYSAGVKKCVCMAGWYGSTKCSKCKANTYNPNMGASVCNPCPSGATSGVGAISCSGGSSQEQASESVSPAVPILATIVALLIITPIGFLLYRRYKIRRQRGFQPINAPI